MKTWKRALALVLALVMALSLVALPSFAEGETGTAAKYNVIIKYVSRMAIRQRPTGRRPSIGAPTWSARSKAPT